MAETKKRAGAQPAKDAAIGAIAWGALEFSKKLATFIIALFGMHVLISLVAVILGPERYAVPLKSILDACMPIYLMGVAGYDAKAGMENALKINNQTKQFASRDEAIG